MRHSVEINYRQRVGISPVLEIFYLSTMDLFKKPVSTFSALVLIHLENIFIVIKHNPFTFIFSYFTKNIIVTISFIMHASSQSLVHKVVLFQGHARFCDMMILAGYGSK